MASLPQPAALVAAARGQSKRARASVLATEAGIGCTARAERKGTAMTIFAALLIGIVAGSRTMMAPAAIAWGARLGWIDVAPTWAGFMASGWALALFTILAIAELVTDQLPFTPSRKTPPQFAGRIVSGGFSGAVLGALAAATIPGLVAGVLGAVVGTLGGAALRGRLAAAFGSDRPAALIEDAAAIVLGLIAVAIVP
jgi:uncharacterized membrane protein